MRRRRDIAFLPETPTTTGMKPGAGTKGLQRHADVVRFDDRKMYRPKEVSVKGYIRHYDGGKLGDIGALGDRAGKSVTYVMRDARATRSRRASPNSTLSARSTSSSSSPTI
ncbi:MAG: hypothetical protein IPJ30_14335 [Acidobacteria bacterium]|nr:hypothetical protein [Acidobacteriota bacterium]